MQKFQKQRLTSATPGTIFLLLLIFIFIALPAAAIEKGRKPKGPRPVGAVNSSNGSVFPVGKYATILKYYNFTKDQLYMDDDEIDFVRPGTGEKPGKKAYDKSVQKYNLILRTGIYKNIDARLIIPWVDKELKRKSFKGDFTDDNSGIGDIKLLSRYRIMSQKNGPLNLAIGLGVQMPTGSSDETDNSGKPLPGFLQTGSGSWDPIIELGMHKIMGPHWMSSYFMYLMTTEGELGPHDFERPDVFKYNFGYAYALSNMFDLGIELNGEVKGKAELNGVEKDNTGGHSIFISPEVHFKFAKGMHFDLCVPIAVYHNLNGPQLAEDYRIVAKLAMNF